MADRSPISCSRSTPLRLFAVSKSAMVAGARRFAPTGLVVLDRHGDCFPCVLPGLFPRPLCLGVGDGGLRGHRIKSLLGGGVTEDAGLVLEVVQQP